MSRSKTSPRYKQVNRYVTHIWASVRKHIVEEEREEIRYNVLWVVFESLYKAFNGCKFALAVVQGN